MRRRARPGFELDLTETLRRHEDHNHPRKRASATNGKPRRGVPSGPIPRLFTVPEAAAILRVSTRMVRRLIAQNKIAKIHIGRAVRIREEALRALIEECDV